MRLDQQVATPKGIADNRIEVFEKKHKLQDIAKLEKATAELEQDLKRVRDKSDQDEINKNEGDNNGNYDIETEDCD